MAGWSGRACIANSSAIIPSEFDFRPPGKIFMEEYANFIAHKNEKLGSAGQLDDHPRQRQEVSIR